MRSVSNTSEHRLSNSRSVPGPPRLPTSTHEPIRQKTSLLRCSSVVLAIVGVFGCVLLVSLTCTSDVLIPYSSSEKQQHRVKRGVLHPLTDSSSPNSQHVWVTPYHPPHEPHHFIQHQPNAHTQPPPRGRGYEWVAWGRLWQVWVWPDAGFLAPNLLLREEGKRSSTVLPRSGLADCFMRGVVLGSTQSDVALNACDGLSGVIRIGADIYFLEPTEYKEGPRSESTSANSQKTSSSSNSELYTKDEYLRDNLRLNLLEATSSEYHSNSRTTQGSAPSLQSSLQISNLNSLQQQITNSDRQRISEDRIEKEGVFPDHNDAREEVDETQDVDSAPDVDGAPEGDGLHLESCNYTLFGSSSPPRLHIMRRVGGGGDSVYRGGREKRGAGEEFKGDDGGGGETSESDGRSENGGEYSDVSSELMGHIRPKPEHNTLHVCHANTELATEPSSTSEASPEATLTSEEEEGAAIFSRHRSKRFIFSKPYTMEVLLVVDAKMVRYHGRHVEQYVLTLMSMVSLIYRDSSLGNLIDIAVVEVLRPDGKTFASKSSSGDSDVGGKSAEDMLKDFCKWQRQGLKQNTEHPRRFDTALLITRENICRNPYTQNCDTLGLAELGTMCSRHASCAIVQDNGLSAAFTIAHELGHLLNMPHDNDAKCKVLKSTEGKDVHMNVMSRMLDHNTLPWIWSNCSRHYLTEYLQAGHAKCLEDSAHTNKLVEDELELTLAGELFNATKQCQYVFGRTTRICPYMPKCKRLWCTTSLDEKEGCKTQHMPWADGTPCGTGLWCLRGECLPRDKEHLQKIHGQWGHWQPWSVCSRSCGVGVSRSERYCDSPKPLYGGKYCVGEKVRYKSCIMEPCPRGASTTDFRTQQCQAYNGKNFGLPDIADTVKWIPKYAGIRHEDSCKLFCQVSNSSVYYQLKEKVEDGTTCGPNTYDICVNGKCRVAGCDYVLNSTVKDDYCGICGGDNSTCQITTGNLHERQQWGYSDVTVIPEGAARIEVIQRAFHDQSDDDNYLALVDLETGEYLLNGHWIVTPFQKTIEFGGTMLEYSGSNSALERVNSTKPLQKKLLVQILSVGKLNPPYIRYSYTKSNLHSDPTYYWRLADWSNCTEPCAGIRERTSYCVSASGGLRVGDYLCSHTPRPVALTESCALSCPVTWKYREWSPCKLGDDGTCGRQRAVAACETSSGTEVEHERCRADSLPDTAAQCDPEECPLWRYHDWAPCSCTLGATKGKQQRLYSCELRGRPVQTWKCRGLNKPQHIRNCSCWHAEPWDQWCKVNGQSSATQMELRQLEEVYSITRYTDNTLPNFNFSATIGEAPMTLHSVDGRCGRGLRRRAVVCGDPSSPKPDHLCDIATKPPDVAPCHIPCPTTTSTTTTPAPSVFGQKIFHSEDSYYATRRDSLDSSNAITVDSPVDQRKGRGQGLSSSAEEDNTILHEGHYNTLDDSFQNHPDFSSRDTYKNERYVTNTRRVDDVFEDESNDLILSGVNIVDPPQGGWQVGDWGKCSVECGGGYKRRLVVCRDGRRSSECPSQQRPTDRIPCNDHPCSEWTVGEWTGCRAPRKRPCGRGRRRRPVICRDINTNRSLPQESCLLEDKPQNSSSCRIPCKSPPRRHHYRYKWRRGPWSGCSESCDQGLMNRRVSCMDRLANDVNVHEDYCLRQGLTKPRHSRNCNEKPCPFRWLAGDWSECSARCGPGTQDRSVTCHAVSPLNWVDPDPAPSGCKPRKVPPTSRPCNMGECARGYFWAVKPWKQCQAVCGAKGRQRRRVFCVDPRGNRVRATRCARSARPRRKQRCQAPQCGLTSCKQARDILKLHVDGEYALLVGGVNVSIYCLGMNVSEPREYLTLPAGEEGNYAEIYSKRLIRPDTCPYNGDRRHNCACMQDESGRAGYTTFSRIRLNITTLSVNMYDFTFAYPVEGRQVAYGEAGDCYSMAQCPQGTFSINLVGTPLKVSDRTTWVGYGNKAAHWINRLDDGQRILGRCGGYCGTCAPDPKIGLKLDIRLPSV